MKEKRFPQPENLIPFLSHHLSTQGGVILLDGLDEVPETAQKRVQVIQLILSLKATFPLCRICVTCRTYTYQAQRQLPNFTAVTLAVSRGQIVLFIRQWHPKWRYYKVGQNKGQNIK